MGIVINNPSSVDLTAPPTSIGTTTPPAITASTIFRSGNSGNIAFVAQPFGTGAFQLQQTDNTATGGDNRGANAIDLQTSRSAASQVASGAQSIVLGSSNRSSGISAFSAGFNNVSSGAYAASVGVSNSSLSYASLALGNSNTANGTNSVALGAVNTASGESSIAVGTRAFTKAVASLFVVGSALGGLGQSQSNQLSIGGQTTDATPTVLRSTSSAASAANQLALQNNSALAFNGLVVGTVTGAGNTASFKIEGCIKRGSNAASTVLVGAVTPVLISRDSGASTWSVSVTADTTNGCLAVTVTGEAATNIRWNCTLYASEVAF